MEGGTFTISNGGVFGSLYGTPIINPPQSAILGMHAIVDRPMAVDGKVSSLCFSFRLLNQLLVGVYSDRIFYAMRSATPVFSPESRRAI